jgi:hypothetical protein
MIIDVPPLRVYNLFFVELLWELTDKHSIKRGAQRPMASARSGTIKSLCYTLELA